MPTSAPDGVPRNLALCTTQSPGVCGALKLMRCTVFQRQLTYREFHHLLSASVSEVDIADAVHRHIGGVVQARERPPGRILGGLARRLAAVDRRSGRDWAATASRTSTVVDKKPFAGQCVHRGRRPVGLAARCIPWRIGHGRIL
jgi:hypothetical protein